VTWLSESTNVKTLKIHEAIGNPIGNYRNDAESWLAVKDFLTVQIEKLCSLFLVSRKPSEKIIESYATILIDKHMDLSLDDFAIMFDQVLSGTIGGVQIPKLYEKIDLETINIWIGMYRDYRTPEAESKTYSTSDYDPTAPEVLARIQKGYKALESKSEENKKKMAAEILNPTPTLKVNPPSIEDLKRKIAIEKNPEIKEYYMLQLKDLVK